MSRPRSEDVDRDTPWKKRRGGPACDACRIRKIKCDAPPSSPMSTQRPKCTPCARSGCSCIYSHARARRGPQPGYMQKLGARNEVDFAIDNSGPSESRDNIAGVGDFDFERDLAGSPLLPHMGPSSIVTDSNALVDSDADPFGHVHTARTALINPLDAVLPRHILFQILDFFLIYLYPLVPLPHWPTLLQDITSKREERHGEEEWTTLVLAIVAFTVTQAPCQRLGLSKPEARDLVDRCTLAIRQYLGQVFSDEQVTCNRMIIMVHYCTILLVQGKESMARGLHGSNVALALQLGMQHESFYESLPPLKREIYRRLWWLIYIADRASSCAERGSLLLEERRYSAIGLPACVDDNYLSDEGIAAQPAGYVPIVTGYIYCCKMYRLASQLLERRKWHAIEPFSAEALAGQIRDMDDMMFCIEEFMADCPRELQLDNIADDSSRGPPLPVDLFAPDSMFLTPDATNEVGTSTAPMFTSSAILPVSKSSYQVQQANLYVTLQLLRMMTVRYKETLLIEWMNKQNANPPHRQDTLNVSLPSRICTIKTKSIEGALAEIREKQITIQGDMLDVLRVLPLEVQVVNSFPGISKIRYVACSLVNEVTIDCSVVASRPGTPNTIARQNQSRDWLCEYLTFLASIEGMYSLE